MNNKIIKNKKYIILLQGKTKQEVLYKIGKYNYIKYSGGGFVINSEIYLASAIFLF